jgi:D-arginine dehydrogenase
LFIESYGNRVVRALTRASRDTFYTPPADFTSTNLVKPRNILVTASVGRGAELKGFERTLETDDPAEYLAPSEAVAMCPMLKVDMIDGAILTRRPADIEVHELQQAYLRMMKRAGGTLATNSRVIDIQRNGGGWRITLSGNRTINAGVIVNAAGAWAGEIGKSAGAADIGLVPLKRSAFLVEAPSEYATQRWPLVADVDEQFYIKPDAGMLLISPSDETPVAPGDVQPDELDIAIAVDRVERVTSLQVRRISHKWAGLRSLLIRHRWWDTIPSSRTSSGWQDLEDLAFKQHQPLEGLRRLWRPTKA